MLEKIESLKERVRDGLQGLAKRFKSNLPSRPANADHKEASSQLERGRKLYNRKNYPKAEEHFRNALLADEGYCKAHYFLGLVLYKRDDAAGAMKAWKRAVELNPSDSSSLKADRKIRYVQGHMNRAINELENRVRRG